MTLDKTRTIRVWQLGEIRKLQTKFGWDIVKSDTSSPRSSQTAKKVTKEAIAQFFIETDSVHGTIRRIVKVRVLKLDFECYLLYWFNLRRNELRLLSSNALHGSDAHVCLCVYPQFES